MGKIISEATKIKIREMREKDLTIDQIAKALEISESTVKKYSSSNPDKDNKIDEKISDEMGKIMLLEGYDFEDEIKPLSYALKNQANELDITLYDYLNDIKDNTNKFLRITDNPIRLNYLFMVFATNLNFITEHIEPDEFVNMIDNFCEREIDMEDAEQYITKIKEDAELIKTNTEEQWNENQKRIESAKKEAVREVELKSQTLLKNSKEEYAEYQEKINNARKELTDLILKRILIQDKDKSLEKENQELKKTLNQTDKEKSLLEEAFMRLGAEFPVEAENIVQELIET